MTTPQDTWTKEIPRGGRALFISPHLDDVPLSCGGLVAMHASQDDRPVVLTVFAKTPGTRAFSRSAARFHLMSGVGSAEGDLLNAMRRSEERAALAELRAHSVVLDGHLEAIYRSYGDPNDTRDQSIFGDVHEHELGELQEQLAVAAVSACKRMSDATVYLPLGIGKHVDHQLCARLQAVLRRVGATVRHYEDSPYVLRMDRAARRGEGVREFLEEAFPAGVRFEPETIDVTPYIEARMRACGKYGSQLRLLFRGDWREELMQYASDIAENGRFAERVWTIR